MLRDLRKINPTRPDVRIGLEDFKNVVSTCDEGQCGLRVCLILLGRHSELESCVGRPQKQCNGRRIAHCFENRTQWTSLCASTCELGRCRRFFCPVGSFDEGKAIAGNFRKRKLCRQRTNFLVHFRSRASLAIMEIKNSEKSAVWARLVW